MRWAGVLAVLVLAAGFLPGARAYDVQTIEVSEAGFNPEVCQMNREYLRFKNVGSTPRRVVRYSPTPGGGILFDSGWLEPGEVSREEYMGFPGTFRFEDFENPDHAVIVKTPVFSATWPVICSPDPAKQPPPPICRGQPHCLRVAAVAAD
ncbi:hypothetical protein [Tepidiforma sp.]|uniref:hypothetical protein n=1 Tax=Tepidiforma sp. TaxID=2682230 RepID=UPI002ADD32D2|nr:hypothetical protein [Tepidiforma sp.]